MPNKYKLRQKACLILVREVLYKTIVYTSVVYSMYIDVHDKYRK
jgi:hypothetical protein